MLHSRYWQTDVFLMSKQPRSGESQVKLMEMLEVTIFFIWK
jgi:hypothetical protein